MKADKVRFQLLDALRGIAAVLVVLYHFTATFKSSFDVNFLNGYFRFGQSGVDFFFILSAFILSYRYNGVSFTIREAMAFLKKRLVRLYPPYWIMALLVFLAYIILFPQIINVTFIISSITLYPYWPKLIIPAWTLSYEVMFYGLFAVGKIIRNKKFVIIFSTVYILLLVLYNLKVRQILLVDLPLMRGFKDFLTSFIMIEFFMGILLYQIFTRMKKIPSIFIKMVLVLSTVYFVYLGFIYETYFTQFNDVRRLIIIAIPISMLILSAALLETTSNVTIPSILARIGEASFSIFITHAFILSAVTRIAHTMSYPNVVCLYVIQTLGLIAAVLFGFAFHFLIEKRLSNGLTKKAIKAGQVASSHY